MGAWPAVQGARSRYSGTVVTIRANVLQTLCARHWAEHLKCIISFNPHNNSYYVGVNIISILQSEKPRHWEGRSLFPGRIGNGRESLESVPEAA